MWQLCMRMCAHVQRGSWRHAQKFAVSLTCPHTCSCSKADICVFLEQAPRVPRADTCVFQAQTHVCRRSDTYLCANACKDNLLTKPRLHMLTNPTVYSTSWHRHVDNNPLRKGMLAHAHRTRIGDICAHTCLHG